MTDENCPEEGGYSGSMQLIIGSVASMEASLGDDLPGVGSQMEPPLDSTDNESVATDSDWLSDDDSDTGILIDNPELLYKELQELQQQKETDGAKGGSDPWDGTISKN